jgi:glutamate racemase
MRIGVFDSGMGGLSTLSACVRAVPEGDFLYYGDAAHAPYGERAEAEIVGLVTAAVDAMPPLDALVIACNTVTAAAVEPLRRRLRVPVVGVEPAVKPACRAAAGAVLLLVTPATAASARLACLLAAQRPRVVLVSAQPRLAPDVERLYGNPYALFRLLWDALLPYRRQNVGAVVLGCTHYALVRREAAAAARAVFNRPVPVFDGNDGAARRLRALLPPAPGPGSVTITASAPEAAERYKRVFAALLPAAGECIIHNA